MRSAAVYSSTTPPHTHTPPHPNCLLPAHTHADNGAFVAGLAPSPSFSHRYRSSCCLSASSVQIVSVCFNAIGLPSSPSLWAVYLNLSTVQLSQQRSQSPLTHTHAPLLVMCMFTPGILRFMAKCVRVRIDTRGDLDLR